MLHSRTRSRLLQARSWVVALVWGWAVCPLAAAGAATAGYAAAVPRPAIAIIIDDLGNQQGNGRRAIEVPGELTYSVLPHTPFAEQLARLAYESGKEVMLHLPMESMRGLPLGPGGLTADMHESELVHSFLHSLGSIPHVHGLNNHMGSLLTTRERPMRALMQAVRECGDFYFVDSLTVAGSLITRLAREHGIPTTSRDIFLDNVVDRAEIAEQFSKLIAHAKTHGTALAIGHPHSETIDVLRELVPGLHAHGVELVSVSSLIARRRGGRSINGWAPSPQSLSAGHAAQIR